MKEKRMFYRNLEEQGRGWKEGWRERERVICVDAQ